MSKSTRWMIMGQIAILACLLPLTGCKSGGFLSSEPTSLATKDQLESSVGKQVTLTGDIAVQPFKTVYLISDGFAIRLPASFAEKNGEKDVTVTGILRVESALVVPAADAAASQPAATSTQVPAIFYLDEAAIPAPAATEPAPTTEAAPAAAPATETK